MGQIVIFLAVSIIAFVLFLSISHIVQFLLQKKRKHDIDSHTSPIVEFHPTTFKDFQKQISHDIEVLEKLDGNVQKEKAEPIMRWAQKSK